MDLLGPRSRPGGWGGARPQTRARRPRGPAAQAQSPLDTFASAEAVPFDSRQQAGRGRVPRTAPRTSACTCVNHRTRKAGLASRYRSPKCIQPPAFMMIERFHYGFKQILVSVSYHCLHRLLLFVFFFSPLKCRNSLYIKKMNAWFACLVNRFSTWPIAFSFCYRGIFLPNCWIFT